MNAIDFLKQRRSTPARQLREPGPTSEQVRQLLLAALRVPDHGKLAPFRLLAIQGQARLRLGEFLAARALERDPQTPAAVLDKDRSRFSHAPLVLTVIAHFRDVPKVPRDEQLLSAGCVCFALLQAAQALGFGAQWLTGWAATDTAVMQHLGLAGNEAIVGFIHIGTAQEEAPERLRPELEAHFSVWPG